MSEAPDTLRPEDPLSTELAAALLEFGAVTRAVADLPVEVQQWRAAARAAARGLGRPVLTRLSPQGTVWAALRDWPATDAERQRHTQHRRDAIRRAAPIRKVRIVSYAQVR